MLKQHAYKSVTMTKLYCNATKSDKYAQQHVFYYVNNSIDAVYVRYCTYSVCFILNNVLIK